MPPQRPRRIASLPCGRAGAASQQLHATLELQRTTLLLTDGCWHSARHVAITSSMQVWSGFNLTVSSEHTAVAVKDVCVMMGLMFLKPKTLNPKP